MSEMQLSTAVSDFVLALSSYYSAFAVQKSSKYGSAGFLIVGFAASLGVLRFGSVLPRYQTSVHRMHVVFSWLGSIFGMPLLATAFCTHYGKSHNAMFHLLSGLAAFILSIAFVSMQNILTQIVSSLAIFGIILTGFLYLNYYGLSGAIVVAIAAGLNGMDTIFGIKGVDWFHYTLVVGNTLLTYGLLQK